MTTATSKSNCFYQQTLRLCTCISLAGMSLTSTLHDYDVKPSKATVYGVLGHSTTRFLNMDKFLRNSTPRNVAYISKIEGSPTENRCVQSLQGRRLITFESLPSSSSLLPNIFILGGWSGLRRGVLFLRGTKERTKNIEFTLFPSEQQHLFDQTLLAFTMLTFMYNLKASDSLLWK